MENNGPGGAKGRLPGCALNLKQATPCQGTTSAHYRPYRPYRPSALFERLLTSNRHAQNQRVHVVRPFVRIDRFQVGHVPHRVVLGQDPVGAQQPARFAGSPLPSRLSVSGWSSSRTMPTSLGASMPSFTRPALTLSTWITTSSPMRIDSFSFLLRINIRVPPRLPMRLSATADYYPAYFT